MQLQEIESRGDPAKAAKVVPTRDGRQPVGVLPMEALTTV